MRTLWIPVALALVGCGKGDDHEQPKQKPAPPSQPVTPVAAPTQDAAPPPDAAPPDPVGEFDRQAKEIYRVIACAGDAEIPRRLSKRVVDAHCERMTKIDEKYREHWLDVAMPFFAKLVPPGLPDVVIYPFGGEDLVSALAVFPDAREITLISLEKGGDPRAIDREIEPEELSEMLKSIREHLSFLSSLAFHRTEDLKVMAENPVPQQLVGALWGLSVHQRVPVSLRFFTIADDGSVVYTTKSFDNFELTFRKPGGPLQTYRHVATNLANRPLEKNPGMVTYLEQRKPFVAIMKAASFLIWKPYFSTIRDLMLDNMVWMVSDATAPLPAAARKKGFELITYGRFEGPEVAFDEIPEAEAMVELWASQPRRKLPFRWGYYDAKRHRHLLVTRKKHLAQAIEKMREEAAERRANPPPPEPDDEADEKPAKKPAKKPVEKPAKKPVEKKAPAEEKAAP